MLSDLEKSPVPRPATMQAVQALRYQRKRDRSRLQQVAKFKHDGLSRHHPRPRPLKYLLQTYDGVENCWGASLQVTSVSSRYVHWLGHCCFRC